MKMQDYLVGMQFMASKVGKPKGFPSLAPKGQTADGSIVQFEAPRDLFYSGRTP